MAIRSKARHDLTLRSIKREIAARRDVAYWRDKADTHLDSGLLLENDIAEVLRCTGCERYRIRNYHFPGYGPPYWVIIAFANFGFVSLM